MNPERWMFRIRGRNLYVVEVSLAVLIVAAGCAGPRTVQSPGVMPPALAEELRGLQQGTPEGQVEYVVQPKDTLWSISKRFGTSVAAISRANGIADPNQVKVGQRLLIPVWESQVPRTAAPAYQVKGSGTLAWRVRGGVVRRFGEKVGGVAYKGIEIQAQPGEKVTAVDSGRVEFVSDSFRGLGKVVMTSHAGGLLALYGGLGRISVKVNDTVERGQAIGEAAYGTGTTSIHFRIYKDNELKDPLLFLR